MTIIQCDSSDTQFQQHCVEGKLSKVSGDYIWNCDDCQ